MADEMNPPITWLSDRGDKAYADYECPACHGIERLSTLMDGPPMHRHRYGSDQLQTGVVILQKIRR